MLLTVTASAILILELRYLIVIRICFWDYLDKVWWSPLNGGRRVLLLSDQVAGVGTGEERGGFLSCTSQMPCS